MTNGHGGRRAGAGPKPGSANRETRELADQAAMEGINPVEDMLGVMRDPAVEPERRDRMAVAVVPYIHPRLAAVDARVDHPIAARVSRAEIAEQARRAIAEAFREWEERPNGPVIEHQNSPSRMVIAISRLPKPIVPRYLFRETLRGRVRLRP